MQWDLGIQGVGLLVLMSLGAGIATHLIWGRTAPRWLWLAATCAFVVVGMLVSEAWFGWATEEELQPNIDGLSFDETMLGMVMTLAVVITARLVTRRRHRGHPIPR